MRKSCDELENLTYNSWRGMKNRCRNPSHVAYHMYGGRGIKYCERWEYYKNFLEDMGKKPHPSCDLDRIDNDKGYFKENCRWTSRKQNLRNTRRTVIVTAFGQTKSLPEWAEDIRCQTRRSTILNRLNSGWTPEQAITTPGSQEKISGWDALIKAICNADLT